MREEGAILLNAQDNGGGAGRPARRRGDAVTATREDAGQIGPGPPKFLGEGGTSGRPSRRAEGDSQDESIYGEVIEVDGLLWKPRPEASSSSEEFRRARSLILEIDRDASWNPWVREDRAQEYEQKINSGDPRSIAEVVRDLHRNAGQPDQSFSERQMYQAALDRLVREFAAVERISEETATQRLEAMLKAA